MKEQEENVHFHQIPVPRECDVYKGILTVDFLASALLIPALRGGLVPVGDRQEPRSIMQHLENLFIIQAESITVTC